MDKGYPPPDSQQQQMPPPQQQPPPPQQPPPAYQGGPPPPMGYSHAGNTNVTVIQTGPPARPSNYMALAVIVCLCCNAIFGIIAIIFSVLSSSAYDDGDIEGAKTKGKISMGISLAGVIFSIICIIITIVIVVTVVNKAIDVVEDSYEEWDPYCNAYNTYGCKK